MGEPGLDDAVRMEIKGMMLDPSERVHVVILRDEKNELLLPIWIGPCEAQAIAVRIQGQELSRPMTHDLLNTSIATLGGTVHRVLISDLKDDTFFALIHVEQRGQQLAIDARPSDAIALALRAEAPIYVRRAVLEKAKSATSRRPKDSDELRKWLEAIDPDDLGKYKM